LTSTTHFSAFTWTEATRVRRWRPWFSGVIVPGGYGEPTVVLSTRQGLLVKSQNRWAAIDPPALAD
jgi:hypothetical protein